MQPRHVGLTETRSDPEMPSGGLLAAGSRLRIAVLCDCEVLEMWQAEAITCMLDSGLVEVCVFILNDSKCGDAAPRDISARIGHFAWNFFCRRSGARAFRPVNLSATFPNIPFEPLADVRRRWLRNLSRLDDVPSMTAERRLDVIMNFSAIAIDDDTLSLARHGVWCLSRTRKGSYAGGPVAFWEIINGDPVIGASLYRLRAAAREGVILREGCLKTVPGSYSRTVDSISFECARWPAYAVREIYSGRGPADSGEEWAHRPQTDVPRWWALARFFVAHMRESTKNAMRKLRSRRFVAEWHVGVVRMKIEEILAGEPLRSVEWLQSGSDYWYADPFVLSSNGKITVLLEKMQGTGKAVLASVDLNNRGWGTPEEVLALPGHVSYPCLVEADGKVFIAPETCELNELALYEAIAFPRLWEKVAVLLPGVPAVDATVFRHGALWWLLGTMRDSANEILLGFYATDLFGPWYGHSKNPLKIDVRSARSAGAVFEIGGVLYRPSQDCSQTYGGRIIVHRIIELDEDHWSEVPVLALEASRSWPYNQGLHTIAVAGDQCIIDAKTVLRK